MVGDIIAESVGDIPRNQQYKTLKHFGRAVRKY